MRQVLGWMALIIEKTKKNKQRPTLPLFILLNLP